MFQLLQVAHNRRARATNGEAPEERLAETSQVAMQASSSSAVDPATEAEAGSVYGMWVWWVGMGLTIGGEVGNFAAYGDVNTPASVVTAVGCVGVICNVVIATSFLGEPFRWRDVCGAGLVVSGVILLVAYAPQQACKLTGARFYWLLYQPAAIALLVLLVCAITVLYFQCPVSAHGTLCRLGSGGTRGRRGLCGLLRCTVGTARGGSHERIV